MIFTYFLAALTLDIIWVAIFFYRQDLRKPMILMSTIFTIIGILGVFFMWTHDWWMPENLTNSLVGIEDVLFGFGVVGVTVAAYPVICKKKLHNLTKQIKFEKKLFVAFLGFAIPVVTFYGFGYSSFYSWLFGMVFTEITLFLFRRDLVLSSLISSAAITLWAISIFIFMNIIDPGFIQRWYLLGNLSGIVLFGPLEDLLWFISGGLLFGAIYPFWTDKTFVNQVVKDK